MYTDDEILLGLVTKEPYNTEVQERGHVDKQ